jgi:oligopeptide/dipeptide ABC transporter ATP-binding protein
MSNQLLTVKELVVRFHVRRGLFGRDSYDVNAVNGVSFNLKEGETLGLVGESGSGKSTIGRALLKLAPVTSGSIHLAGKDVNNLGNEVFDFRKSLQVVFQDPYSSLNPSMVVSEIIEEPLKIHFSMTEVERRHRVEQLMDQVGLSSHQMERYPSEFSGGQRQRIAIARALALEPKMIICDEAISALDVSTQSQVINLLEELQDRLQIAYLFIAHDIAVVRHISDRIAVLYLGRLMEIGPANSLCDSPAHPYTQLLLGAVPITDPVEQKRRKAERRLIPAAELPGPTNIPTGCPFSTRCPKVMGRCRSEIPELIAVDNGVDSGRQVACHLYDS